MKLAIALALLLPAVAHAEGPSSYAYGVAIDTPPSIAFARAAIPSAVYEGASRRDLADMRVFNADGEVVPYAFVPRTSEPPPLAEVTLPMFPLMVPRERGDVDGLALSVVRGAGGTTINVTPRDNAPAQDRMLAGYVLDLGEREDPLVALTFAMPDASDASSMRLRVDASDDLVAWRIVRHDATLVLLEQAGQRLVRNRVELSPTRAKFLRLSWTPGRAVIPFTAVTGEFGTRPAEPSREWRTATGSPARDREGEFEYDLGGAFPVDRIAVDLAAPNSIVPVTLFARGTATEAWQFVGSTVFYRIAQPPVDVANAAGRVVTQLADATNPPFAVDGRARRYWMIRVDPRAGVPAAAAPVLKAGWQAQEIVFAARGRGPFVLAFGKYDATPGALPIETLIPDYATKHALPVGVVLAKAGARVDLGGSERLQKPLDARRWLLWAALVLGAAALGWMAWRLSRELAASERKPSTDVPEQRRD